MKPDILRKGIMQLIGTILIVVTCWGCNSSKGVYENVRGKHLIIAQGNKTLFWFSGIHSNDPQSLMFEDIRDAIQEFHPSYILVEGGSNERNYSSENEAILNGESAFAAHLANNLKIPCGNIEPSDLKINNHLLTTYPPEEILAMYVFRQMYQWQREADHKSIDIEQSLSSFIAGDTFEGLPKYGEQDISSIMDEYVGYHVDNTNWKKVDTYSLVYADHGKLHDVWQATYDYRNQYILEILPGLFTEYDKIFIVMGFDHAEDLKSDLEVMMNDF